MLPISDIELELTKDINTASNFTYQAMSDFWMQRSAENGYSLTKIILEN